jgi:phosphoglycerate dehydrogenase-like enzyme
VTEPDVINLQMAGDMLPEGYELFTGNTAFAGEIPENCTTVLIRSATTVDSQIKRVFPNLTGIIRIGTGVDNIDMTFCDKEDIRVYNAPGANADAVSDYVVCMMLVALRKIFALDPEDAASWNRFKFVGNSMSAQSIGIIGFGNIGKLVYKKLQGFGCKNFYVYDPFIGEAALPDGVTYALSIDDVLANSTVITLHLPLLPETHHIINRGNLELLADGAVLLNASRGGIVDEDAVIECMRHRRLVYVADTVEGEPVVRQGLLDEPNVIVTPHIASLTAESEYNMVKVAVDNFLSESRKDEVKRAPVGVRGLRLSHASEDNLSTFGS